MRLLYSFAITLYALAVRLAAPFHKKARLMHTGWRSWRDNLAPLASGLSGSKVAWFHASSLGEFEQARPVLELLRQRNPEYKVVLTFFSPSGYEVRKNYDKADLVCYLPPDTRRNASDFYDMIHPDVVFFVKYDFWFNYLHVISSHGTPVYLFSAIFRPSQYFFQWYGGWFAKRLQSYSHIFVQNEESMLLLGSIGCTHCSLAGDTRFDRVFDIASQARRFNDVERFVADTPVLIAGSSWEPDEQNIKLFIDSYSRPLKVILAPHVISEDHLSLIERMFGKDNCLRFSSLKEADSGMLQRKVLIIDNIGMLSSLYRYATVAYIGGGFGKGIHNILEAAVFGSPVCFGPNHTKFQEAKGMLECGGARSYSTAEQLRDLLTLWFDDKEAWQKASRAALSFMRANRGATEKIMGRVSLG